MTLSTHILDTEAGRPAPGVRVSAELFHVGEWLGLGSGVTDPDGRADSLVDVTDWVPGRWRVVFETADLHGLQAFYPRVTVEFIVATPAGHHHIPLLLARHGYSTYRGS